MKAFISKSFPRRRESTLKFAQVVKWIPAFAGMTFLVLGSAGAGEIRASSHDRAFCEILARHVPDEDVAYKPDPSVVSADLYGAPSMKIDQTVVFPLSVDLAEHFGLTVPDGVELKPDLGTFKITPDGQVFWNDQDLSEPAAAYCGLDDGQDEDDVIKSETP